MLTLAPESLLTFTEIRSPTKNSCVHRIASDRLTLRALVQDYVSECRSLARAELQFFAQQRTLQATIEVAALCIDSAGFRFSHQRRRSPATLTEARDVLTAAERELRQCRSFRQLHETVDRLVALIADLAELYSYDTALHIGAKLGLEPDMIYLHRGTRVGARNLGLPHRQPTIEPRLMRPELRVLAPYEIEDFLCIYKNYLSVGRFGISLG